MSRKGMSFWIVDEYFPFLWYKEVVEKICLGGVFKKNYILVITYIHYIFIIKSI